MKTLIVAGAVGLSAYLLWLYWQQNKTSSGCGCKDKHDDAGSTSVAAPSMGNMMDEVTADVQTYETSPLKTFNAPDRLIKQTNWPTDDGQKYARG